MLWDSTCIPLAGLLPNIRDKFIPYGPKILLGLYGSHDSIQGGPGLLHIFQHYGPVVYKDLESLSIFTLKHELELLPTLYGCHQLGQVQCLGHPGSQEPWCRRFSSPQTG